MHYENDETISLGADKSPLWDSAFTALDPFVDDGIQAWKAKGIAIRKGFLECKGTIKYFSKTTEDKIRHELNSKSISNLRLNREEKGKLLSIQERRFSEFFFQSDTREFVIDVLEGSKR